ncbi:MAG TPA: DNA polymerase domain-containing protein [Nitrososphaeraceae archaeon]|nr:DNA polymerase domain-containing protein [Nitrososphaeraceae archaeon]
MTSCIGWLFDVSIDSDYAIVSIKTEAGQILKLRDPYRPRFYILPGNDADGLHLFQILSREEEIAVSWADRYTNLFDRTEQTKLLYVQLQSSRCYQPLLKKLQNDCRVKQLFNTDLLHVQQYLFTKLKIEPANKVEVKYDDRLKLLEIVKVDDENDVNPPPFSLLYFDLHTYSGLLASEDSIRIIKVRCGEDEAVFENNEESVILQQFSDYVRDKSPDIMVCMGDYDNGKVLRHLMARAEKIGFELQLEKIYISSSYRKTTYFDQFGFAGLIERARFGFLPLDKAAKYSINRLIDSRNCYELIQQGFVIPSRTHGIDNNNHENIRTVEQIVSGDKGGMIISPQIGLHEDVLALDYDSEYANLFVKHNLSYETVGCKAINSQNKGLLPTIVERYLKRRTYFKKLLKDLPKDSTEYLWCEQRVNSLKNILVCLYGSTGSLWNRFGNVLAFEEINRLSREVLIKTKDIVGRP